MASARALFAERGYGGASLRDIASGAGVDPAMIRHYFGDKETLFITVMTESADIPDRLAAALDGPPGELGRRATRAYLQLWEEEPTRQVLTGLVRSALASPRAAELLSKVLIGRVLEEAPPGSPEAKRAEGLLLAATHLFGVAVARSVFRIAPLAEMAHEELVEAVAPSIQRYLSADRPPSDEGAE